MKVTIPTILSLFAYLSISSPIPEVDRGQNDYTLSTSVTVPKERATPRIEDGLIDSQDVLPVNQVVSNALEGLKASVETIVPQSGPEKTSLSKVVTRRQEEMDEPLLDVLAPLIPDIANFIVDSTGKSGQVTTRSGKVSEGLPNTPPSLSERYSTTCTAHYDVIYRCGL